MAYISGGPVTVKPRTWTTLLTIPTLATALFASYLRVAGADTGTQLITRFIRDPDGAADSTGTEDRVATPGKDYLSRMWYFTPIAGKPVGVQLWHDNSKSLTVEYVQLKHTAL